MSNLEQIPIPLHTDISSPGSIILAISLKSLNPEYDIRRVGTGVLSEYATLCVIRLKLAMTSSWACGGVVETSTSTYDQEDQ